MAVGPGGTTEDGKKIIMQVKVGQKVVYKKWGGNDVEIERIEYQFLKFDDILAVIN